MVKGRAQANKFRACLKKSYSSTTGYAWTGGQTTHVATGLALGTYTVTVTYNNNGSTCTCTSTATAVLSTPTGLSVAIANTLSGTCAGSELCALAAGPDANSYLWSTGETTECINATEAVTYTVTVTDVNGCTATDDYDDLDGVLNPGCCGNYEDDFDEVSPFTYTISSDATITADLNVNGDIPITSGATLTLQGCSLAIAPGFGIYIAAGCSLIIEMGSVLYSCTGMWAGIYNQGGTVIIDGSEVDDAIYALYAPYTGYHAVFEITNSIFDRNYISVLITDDDYSTSIFTGNVMQCTSPLKNSAYGTLTFKQFYLTGVTSCNIGDAGQAPNNIKDANRGIDGDNSTYNVVNNYFFHIGADAHDAALFADNSTQTNSITATGNFIENCTNGTLISTEYDCTIDGNTFTRCEYGAYVSDNDYGPVHIQYNQFTDCDYGAELYNLTYAPFTISDNTFLSALNSDDEPANAEAIGVDLPACGNVTAYILRNNIINYPTGIFTNGVIRSDADPVTIAYNNIKWTVDKDHLGSPDYYGIWNQNGYGILTSTNVIDWAGGPIDPYDWGAESTTSSNRVTGIRSDGTTDATIHLNTMNRNGTAIYMTGSSVNNYITCDSIFKSYPGVYLDNVTSLPDQGSASETYNNNWFGNYSSTRLKINGISTPPSDWYYAGTLDDPQPCNTFVANPNPITGLYTDHCYVAQNRNSNSGSSNYYSESTERIINKVIGDSAVYASNVDENRYNNLQSVYKMMKMDSVLVSTSAREQFVQATETENIGLLVAVTDSIATGDLLTAESINNAIIDTNVMESNKRTVNDIVIAKTLNGVLMLDANDSAVLLSIAYQDPIHGGEAVYKARAILRLRIADNYTGTGARLIQNNNETKLKNDECLIVYPVPSRGFIFIKPENESIVEIKLYDLKGIQVFSNHLKTSVGACKLNLTSLTAGTYTLTVIDSNNKTYSGKIILTK